MRKYIMPIVVAAALGLSTSAMAYDSGDVISMQDALGIATDLGLTTVSNTEFQGDEWRIEGRDPSGKWMQVYVDATTGDVRGVERGW